MAEFDKNAKGQLYFYAKPFGENTEKPESRD